jgi:sensor histidine kinase regulating citrate/malate metabolism
LKKIADDQYRIQFENAPIPLVEADFTKLVAFIADSSRTCLEPGSSPADNQDLIRSWTGKVVCTNANKAAHSMFGSHSCQDLVPKQFLAGTSLAIMSFISLVDSLKSGKSNWNGYSEIVKASGKILNVSISAGIAVSNNGKDIRVIFSFTDVTELMRELIAARHANKVVSELTSDVRHDILNQLIAITGYIDLSLEESSLSTIYNYIEKGRTAAETISRQIASTKAYQHLGESGPAWYILGDLITTKADPPGDFARTMIYADPGIRNVFLILESVMKSLGGKSPRIRWSMESGEDGVRIICEADGKGIPPEDKERVFQRTWQGPSSLFPAREILGVTGITIREEGKTGIVTRFIVTVPAYSFSIQPE